MSDTKKATRRARGEGTITEVRKGYFVGQFDLGKHPTTGKRQRKKVTGSTKKEVADRLRELRKAHESGVNLSLRPATVAEVARLWLSQGAPTTRGKKSPATLTRLTERLERHLIPALGEVRISDVTHEHVERWLAAEAVGGRLDATTGKPRGQARETLLDYRKDVVQVLAWAKRRGYVERTIDARDIYMPEAAPSRPKRTLTTDEARRVMTACTEHRLGAYFALMLTLGMRPQEIDALRWSDLDLDEGVVTIERAMNRLSGGAPASIGSTKTAGSVRRLVMRPDLLPLLRARRAAQVADRLRSGPYWTTDDRWSDLVFTTEVGTPFFSTNLRREWERVRKAAEVQTITLYELRHSAASLYVEQGADLVQVADLLGHANTRMLERRYRHRVSDVVRLASVVDPIGKAAEA